MEKNPNNFEIRWMTPDRKLTNLVKKVYKKTRSLKLQATQIKQKWDHKEDKKSGARCKVDWPRL